MIADVAALEKMPNRFSVTQAFRGKIVPNKADSVEDAESLLKQISKKKPYHKSSDNPKIAEKQDALQIGCNSRSFRRFLRLLQHPIYAEQSFKSHSDCGK
jgi:hypothetical protein